MEILERLLSEEKIGEDDAIAAVIAVLQTEPPPARTAAEQVSISYEIAEIRRTDLLPSSFLPDDYRWYLAQALKAAENDTPDYRTACHLLMTALYLAEADCETCRYALEAPAAVGHTIVRALQVILLADAPATETDRRWQWRFEHAVRQANQLLRRDCKRHKDRHRWELVREAKRKWREMSQPKS